MPNIKLPDGKTIQFSEKIDGFQIASKISKSLTKEACVMSIDGEQSDSENTYVRNYLTSLKLNNFHTKRIWKMEIWSY